jgi:uncharacterized protein YodC (DUF2158 family)
MICERQMTSELKIGDVVMLKSGGPLMVVKEMIAPEGDIFCVWFDGPERYGSRFRPEDLSPLD